MAGRRARDDLRIAGEGKIDFRRFQPALDHHEAHRVDCYWEVSSSERRIGRVRDWLADKGRDPIP